MTASSHNSDAQRERWRQVRCPLHLLEPEAGDFATGGLARLVTAQTVRLLILPADPDAFLIEFDDAFWSWWLQDWPDPITGQPTPWGSEGRPTATAAIRGWRAARERWDNYLALHRHGGLEVELGNRGAYERNDTRIFRLIPIVGWIWAAFELYRGVIAHFDVGGPWEISLALSKTARSYLGQLGEGWAEPGSVYHDLPPHEEPGLLLRRELNDWPDTMGVQALAFSLGAWLEDSWSMRARRFLAHRGTLAGQFDRTKYR